MIKYILNIRIVVLLIALFTFFTACEEEETPAAPTIDHVRLVSSADKVTAGGLGAGVAIIGTGLETVKSIAFNGEKAQFYGTMVTATSIVTTVPKSAPFRGEEAVNKLTIETEGGSITVDFEVFPPAPKVTSISPEYAGEGGEISLIGDYFYNITDVKFNGGKKAEILSVTPTEIKVKVPVGYTKGKVDVVSLNSGAGSSESDFGQLSGDIVMNWDDI